MPYLIQQTVTGKWVAKSGSEHSYTNDLNQAATFATAREAQKEACLRGESIWFVSSFPSPVFGEEIQKCPYCGCADPPIDGDEVYPRYDGYPCCPECRGV